MAEQQQDKQQQTTLKISVLHYRDQSHDEATFLKWYLEEQIPRFIPIAHKHGIDPLRIGTPLASYASQCSTLCYVSKARLTFFD